MPETHFGYLQKATLTAPPGLPELLNEIGRGVNGFAGTEFGCGKTISQILHECVDGEYPSRIAEDSVPESVFWIIDSQGTAVGMVRARHYLNQQLRQRSGHIGYFVRRADRGKGYAKLALQMATDFLKQRGQPKILVTVQPDNIGSRQVVCANGGVYAGQGESSGSGRLDRYWI